ncbi:MAG: phosphotransferase family protein [Xanthomonadales bacterium]|nr:phosphotransferase family protein [Xanthomonadales bacterium]
MTDAGNPTIEVRSDEALDWQRLDRYLKQAIPGLDGQPQISQYPSGRSNLTYQLSYPGRDLVIRRPPFGAKPKSGHSMSREHHVMTALKPVFPAVPDTLLYTDDPDIIGAEFYVMEKSPGIILDQQRLQAMDLDESRVRRLCLKFFEKLIELHQVDIEAAGLTGFGRPEGYIERQISGWNQRYQAVKTPNVDAFDDVQQWLENNRPNAECRASVLHGDYRLDNALIDVDDDCRIVAILDWEISALGDPLMDLGNALCYWVEAGDPPYLQNLAMQPSAVPGMLTRDEILSFYAERTGLDTSRFRFFLVYGYFRLAAVLQQIYFRYHNGQTRDARFAHFDQAVMALGNHSRRLIRGD